MSEVRILLRRINVDGSSIVEHLIVGQDDVGANPILPPDVPDVRGVVARKHLSPEMSLLLRQRWMMCPFSAVS